MIKSHEPQKHAVLRAGERLFAQRSFDLVTDEDIAAEAGATSADAVTEHFGSRTGLLREIIDRHQIPIDTRRNRLIDDLVGNGKVDTRGAAEALVYPGADNLSNPHGGRDYLLICARLRLEPELFKMLLTHSHGIGRAMDLLVPKATTEPAVRSAKVRVVSAIMVNGLADCARAPETYDRAFVEILIDSICAVTTAVPTATIERLPADRPAPEPTAV